jgi:osmotically-inducible protein OsmY
MNKSTWTRRLGAAVVMTALLAGCASSNTRESTGEYIDDTGLTTRVKTAIFNEPMLKVGQVNVESYKGVVQISGFVDSVKASVKATQVAESVKGVQEVKNSLIVK